MHGKGSDIMNKRAFRIVCHAIAALCWGILTYSGIHDGKAMGIALYGLCFVLSLVSLGVNIRALIKGKSNVSEKG